jgi:hypothetical protein
MASSYPPGGNEQWRVAVRFLIVGATIACVIVSFWLINRLADRVDAQTQLLLVIQRDVLVNQKQVNTVLDAEAKLTETLFQLRALVDVIHQPEEEEPGPKARPRLRR